jgi:glucarate dehydratase
VIVGGKMKYVDGHIEVPRTPGLGVKLDRDKVARYHELYKELGGYPYDRDPGRPGWFPLIPNRDWADPDASSRPAMR